MENSKDAQAADLARAAALARHDQRAKALAKTKESHPQRKPTDTTRRGSPAWLIPSDKYRANGVRHGCGTLAKRVSKRFEGSKRKVWWCPKCNVATVKIAAPAPDMDKRAEAPGLAEAMAAAAHGIGEALAEGPRNATAALDGIAP